MSEHSKDRSNIIIICGPPGAGKTLLGQKLANALAFPFICKDEVKDILFYTLGWKDREWSMKLGQASFEILFHQLESQLQANKSAVVETAFIPEYHNQRFLQLHNELHNEYEFRSVQIVCYAHTQELYKRFINRTKSNERHPGHVDHLMPYNQFSHLLLTRRYEALDTGSKVINVDTSDFDTIEYKSLIGEVASMIER
jgi:shikimate kinase